jgi:signal transduction histidine kinase
MRSATGGRQIYAPILLGAVLIVILFAVAESGYKRMHDASLVISAAEERQGMLTRYLRLLLDAESAHRAFLLTEDPTYLRGFDPAVRGLDRLLELIESGLSSGGYQEDMARVQALRMSTGRKIGEMQASLRLYGEVGRDAAITLLDTEIGQTAMRDLRVQLKQLYDQETERVEKAKAASGRDLRTSRVLLGAASFLSLVLVILLGALLARDMQRREQETLDLGKRNRELDRTVQQRTAMLFHLSSSLQKVAEREKATLARELHDELGGLLVASKIDISWLRRRLDDGTDTSKLRWERVLRCLDEGLTLKRRVIENLRPTLLDNVGLIAALRWLVDESLRRAGIACEEKYPESMPELSPDARIAVYRVVQECLMNIMKHARAKSVILVVGNSDGQLAVTVRDDGIGIDEDRIETATSHGLIGMRHRIESLDGQLTIRKIGPGVGTEVSFRLPLERIQAVGT